MSTTVIQPEATISMFGFGDVPARGITIASVHFQDLDYHDFFHSRNRSFKLAAGKVSEPAYRRVWDSQQMTPDTSALATYQAGEPWPDAIPKPVQVPIIVSDLLVKWQPYYSSDGKGIMAMPYRGIIAIEGQVATSEEIARMDAMEAAHCRALVEQADRFHRSGKGTITEYHRKCLEWLGSERREWFAPIEAGVTKISAISGNRIPMKALADQGLDLLAFYQRNGLNPEDYGDTFAAELLTRPAVKTATRTSDKT